MALNPNRLMEELAGLFSRHGLQPPRGVALAPEDAAALIEWYARRRINPVMWTAAPGQPKRPTVQGIQWWGIDPSA